MRPRAHIIHQSLRLALTLALVGCGLAAAPGNAHAQGASARATAVAPAAVTATATATATLPASDAFAAPKPTPPAPRGRVGEGRLEVGASIGFAGGHDLGSELATETGNGVPSGSPVTLFETDSMLDHGPLIEGRAAWRLTHALAVEGTFSVTRTHLRSSIKNDSEKAAPLVATSRLMQYAAEAGVVWHLNGLSFAHGRGRPFVTGGGGYLRQLHDQATLVETGQSAFVGGGLKYRLHEATRRALLKAIGLRGDVRLNLTHGGFDVDQDAWRKYPSVSGGLFVCF